MEWTSADREKLLSYRTIVDCDDVKIKQKIKSKLLENKYIMHVLNNKELEQADAEPDEYFGTNILDYYVINPTQSKVDNFICYTTSYTELNRYNKSVKLQNISFSILCHVNNIIDKDTGIARHDLLGALILDQFDFTNYFGAKIHCVSSKESLVDSDYVGRFLIFEQNADNNLVKTIDGVPRLANKGIVV